MVDDTKNFEAAAKSIDAAKKASDKQVKQKKSTSSFDYLDDFLEEYGDALADEETRECVRRFLDATIRTVADGVDVPKGKPITMPQLKKGFDRVRMENQGKLMAFKEAKAGIAQHNQKEIQAVVGETNPVEK